jgi:hypothetical protein
LSRIPCLISISYTGQPPVVLEYHQNIEFNKTNSVAFFWRLVNKIHGADLEISIGGHKVRRWTTFCMISKNLEAIIGGLYYIHSHDC